MRVDIKNVEKTQGLIFKKRLYGVETTVRFTAEETAIIKERNLGSIVVLARDFSADQDAEHEANRGIVSRIAKAALERDWDANSPDLTVNKLMRGPDTHYFEHLDHVKIAIQALKEALAELKGIIEGNRDPAEDTSFEL